MPGAGIILVTKSKSNNKVYYFMQYNIDREWLEDFGGIKEDSDSFITTAIKEFIEETNNGFGLCPNELKRMIQYESIYVKTNDLRYHIFVIPVNPSYLKYRSLDFGLIEEHDGMPRVCMWLTKEEIMKFKVHPRCKPFLLLIN